MNLIAIILLLLPITLAIFAFSYLIRRSQLWLEAFAAIISLMLASYGVIFVLGTGDISIFNLVVVISIAQFFGILLFPIMSPDFYQKFKLKSFLFNGQSGASKLARHIQNSRLLSSCIVFFFFLASFGLAFYTLDFIEGISQMIWIILLSAGIAVISAVNWKSG